MKRLVPFPILSLALALSWLMLTEIAVGQALIAVALAIAVPLAIHPLIAGLPRVRSGMAALRLMGIVVIDIVIANVAVARLVLGPLSRLRPAFLQVPLEITDSHSIALLASIITMTPGTVSVALSPQRDMLLVHALNVDDPAEVVATIKSRYEQRIKEVFGC